ncbi:protein-L-isoaspartate(D-aspartate) O-methyltransferase [Sphingomonas arenae]|uniref:protein-L-isoaspartate(D-aspartate) O-methyltransferase n=1 Tax=Sphingomonas arenae TaxID=2812555 RepID=UPI001F000983|nr:protein-L-isoaspartate(D-aspartate) O-methyltransferase [Sphingomonas arenae]
MTDFARLRAAMVRDQLQARGIHDPAVLAAFHEVPRELFVSEQLQGEAYQDRALPIEAEQTISQPFIVAVMLQAAHLSPRDHVLEVGAGSGYAAALMAHLARSVVAVERHAELAELARCRVRRLGIPNVRVVHGDGMLGYSEAAPYDVILCAAANPVVPAAWFEQLAPNGRIIMPQGAHDGPQRLVRLTVFADGRLREEELEPVRFVPLLRGEA